MRKVVLVMIHTVWFSICWFAVYFVVFAISIYCLLTKDTDMHDCSDACHAPRRPRGPYKLYLNPQNLGEVPRTTKWRRLNDYEHDGAEAGNPPDTDSDPDYVDQENANLTQAVIDPEVDQGEGMESEYIIG